MASPQKSSQREIKLQENGHVSRGQKERVFTPRDSPLTDMMRDKNISTIYNIFVAYLITEMVHSISLGLLDGRLDMGQDFIFWNFGKLWYVVLLWLMLFKTTLGVYGGVYCWADKRTNLTPASLQLKLWDYSWLVFYIFYQISFLVLPAILVLRWKLPPVSTSIITIELIRMLMKTYAFVRSNVSKVLLFKPKSEGPQRVCPPFSHYLEFLFYPTLVYRDSYPRTERIRWGFVLKCVLELLGVTFMLAFVLDRHQNPAYQDWGRYQPTPQHIIKLYFTSILPSICIFLCGSLVMVHSTQNIGAELTRFADRLFYEDWWNAESFSMYIRKWNKNVHDWMYTYIYRDLQAIFQPSGRAGITLAVILLSCIGHEYILALSFGFCYPVLEFLFLVFGGAMSLLPPRYNANWTGVLWICQLFGNAIHVTAYSMEWYARINCKQTKDDFADFFIPRSWNCVPISPLPENSTSFSSTLT